MTGSRSRRRLPSNNNRLRTPTRRKKHSISASLFVRGGERERKGERKKEIEHDSPCNRRARRLNCKISRLKIVCYDDGDHSSATEQPAEIARRKSTLQRVLTVEEILNRHAATCRSFSLILSFFLFAPPLSLSFSVGECRMIDSRTSDSASARKLHRTAPHTVAAAVAAFLVAHKNATHRRVEE